MRAALRNGPKKIQCIEIDKPTPLDNEVLISVNRVVSVVQILFEYRKIIQSGIK